MGEFLKGVVQFLHPHYIFNVILSVIFFALKTVEPICSAIFDDCQLELVCRVLSPSPSILTVITTINTIIIIIIIIFLRIVTGVHDHHLIFDVSEAFRI